MLPTKFQNHWLSSSTIFIVRYSPDFWKISKVTPLYKLDSESDFSNYRPISVLLCLSKVLEQVAHCQLSNYLEKHYLLKSSQFAFCPRRSTELACDLLINDVGKNIDNGLQTGITYLDTSKAFDAVSHSHLLSKLPSYGKNGNEFTWFGNYLFNRKQDVFYEGHISKAFPVFRGVPQEPILRPTLFLMHLYDIDNCLCHSSIIKYAEDTVNYVSRNDSESIQKKHNPDILGVCNWVTINDLPLNLERARTETMIFGTSVRVKKTTPFNIQINGTIISQISSYKHLGTHLDSKLALNGSLNSKYKSLSSGLQLLSKLHQMWM